MLVSVVFDGYLCLSCSADEVSGGPSRQCVADRNAPLPLPSHPDLRTSSERAWCPPPRLVPWMTGGHNVYGFCPQMVNEKAESESPRAYVDSLLGEGSSGKTTEAFLRLVEATDPLLCSLDSKRPDRNTLTKTTRCFS